MQARKYEFQSKFARTYYYQGFNKGFDKGFDEGREEGLIAGEARGLLKVLKARGFEAPPSLREHVLGCTDSELIKQWYERAVRAERLEEIFDRELLG